MVCLRVNQLAISDRIEPDFTHIISVTRIQPMIQPEGWYQLSQFTPSREIINTHRDLTTSHKPAVQKRVLSSNVGEGRARRAIKHTDWAFFRSRDVVIHQLYRVSLLP